MAAIIATNVTPVSVKRPEMHPAAQDQRSQAIDVTLGGSKPSLLDQIHGKALSSIQNQESRYAHGTPHDFLDAIGGGVNPELVRALVRSCDTSSVREFGSLLKAARSAGITA